MSYNTKTQRRSNKKFQPNTEMRDALERHSDHLVVKRTTGDRKLYRSADSWKGDGVDHINISGFQALTELGQKLDFTYRLPFIHPIFKKFQTVSGIWAYLRSNERPDMLRNLTGRALQELSRDLTNRPGVKHLKAMVMDSAYQRIIQNKELMRLVYENELPFDMYRIMDTGVKVRPSHHDWVVDGYTEITKAIQGGYEPNFLFLCDSDTADIYESVRPAIPVFQQPLNKPSSKLGKKSKKENKHKFTKNTKPGEYQYDKDEGYIIVIPEYNEGEYFLDTEQRTVSINGIEVTTAPVRSGINIPIKSVSNNLGLYRAGLISDSDVVRPGNVYDNTFKKGWKTNNLIKLNSCYIADETNPEKYINVPLQLKLINRSFTREGDHQEVEATANGYQLYRSILLYKPLHQLKQEDQSYPKMVQELIDQNRDNIDIDSYEFVIFYVRFYLMILNMDCETESEDTEPTVMLSGELLPVGFSTGPHDDEDRNEIRLVPNEVLPKDRDNIPDGYYALKRNTIEGYTFTLFRGKLKEEHTSNTDVDDNDQVDHNVMNGGEEEYENPVEVTKSEDQSLVYND